MSPLQQVCHSVSSRKPLADFDVFEWPSLAEFASEVKASPSPNQTVTAFIAKDSAAIPHVSFGWYLDGAALQAS